MEETYIHKLDKGSKIDRPPILDLDLTIGSLMEPHKKEEQIVGLVQLLNVIF